MIKSGVIRKTTEYINTYIVSIPAGEKYNRLTFFVSNQNDIPYELRQALDNGEHIAGIFQFEEYDHFATYLLDDELTITQK